MASLVHMNTASFERILAPVAAAIGELILIEEEAALEDQPMPDLLPVATGIDASIRNLTGIANKAMSTSTDEAMRADMPEAVTLLEEASKMLLSAATTLHDNPTNSMARQLLPQAARGILDGTCRVLTVFDETEVRRILASCKAAQDAVTRLSSARTLTELAAALKEATPALISISKLADQRAADLVEPRQKALLIDAAAAVRRTTPLVVGAAKVAVQGGNSESAAAARDAAIAGLSALLVDIETATRMGSDQAPDAHALDAEGGERDAHAAAVAAHSEAAAIASAVAGVETQSGEPSLSNAFSHAREDVIGIATELAEEDGGTVLSAVAQFESSASLVVKGASALAADVHSPASRTAIAEAAAAVTAKIAAVKAASATIDEIRAEAKKENADMDAIAERQDAAVEVLKEELLGADAACTRLEAEVGRAVVRDIDACADDARSNLSGMSLAMRSGDVEAYKTHAHGFEVTMAQVAAAATRSAQHTGTEGSGRRMSTAVAALQSTTPQIVAAGMAAAEKSGGGGTKEHFDNLVREWSTHIGTIAEAVEEGVRADVVVSVRAETIHSDVETLKSVAVANDAAMMGAVAASLGNHVGQAVSCAKKEAAVSNDAQFIAAVDTAAVALQSAQKDITTIVTSPASPAERTAQLTAQAAAVETAAASLQTAVATRGRAPTITAPPPAENASAAVELARPASPLPVAPQESERLVELLAAASVSTPSKAAPVEEEEEHEEEAVPVPAMPTAQEIKENPIKAAATELRIETLKWDARDNDMIATATKLSELMTQMADYARSASKKELIQTAQTMAVNMSLIESMGRDIAERCTDKRLRNALVVLLERIPTMATQLKVISSVKAASPRDDGVDAQLVVCARNLMSNVAGIVRASESASICVVGDMEGTMTLKWRRKGRGRKTAK